VESSWLPLPGWLDLIDIALVAGFGWLAIRYLRRTGAHAALLGLALLGLVYVFARALDLQLAAALFQAFFAAVVLVLIVVFQDDLRRLFEQLGSWRGPRSRPPSDTEALDVLVRTIARLAATRTGALVVIPGREPLERHVEGGIVLRGRASEPLMLSLFDSSSPGHDGALILRGNEIERFAVHLPLSANHEALGPGGTRHAAALGLAERCDAICVVVSEERGTVSIAREGELRTLPGAESLLEELRDHFEPERDSTPWWQGGAGVDAAVAAAGALVLWMALVPGSSLQEIVQPVPIEVTNLPAGSEVEAVEPAQVEVTLRGLRRRLLLVDRDDVSVHLDAYLARFGRRTFSLSATNVQATGDLEVVGIEPETVRLSLRNLPEEKR
jgi:uncharacterized protein (TIGR00159 family)